MHDKHIGKELRSLSNLIMRYMDNHSNKKQIDSITGTNGWIIAYIAQHRERDVFQKDFEEEFGVTRSTVSKVVNLMVQKGLIERQNVSYDARLKKLVLTEKAREISNLMRQDGKRMEAVLTKGFEPEELEILSGYIRRMKENLKY